MAHPESGNSRSLLWALPLLLILGVVVADRVLNGKNGATHLEQMQREVGSFPTPPNSELTSTLRHFSVWNSHKATVGTAYATHLKQSDIRDFYDREFKALGWRPVASDSGIGRSYCKGDFSGSLRFENNLPAGASYVLSLDWPGARSCRATHGN